MAKKTAKKAVFVKNLSHNYAITEDKKELSARG